MAATPARGTHNSMQTQQQRQLQDSESAAAALKTQEALLRLHCAAIKVNSLNCFKDLFFAYTFTPGRQSCSRCFSSSYRSRTIGGACATSRLNYLSFSIASPPFISAGCICQFFQAEVQSQKISPSRRQTSSFL